MISRELIEIIYEAASIQRWNDHIRPHRGFTELDKQAHKMVFAYVLARFEEDDRGQKVDWKKLIEAGIFEFLHRIMLTDIKPPIFHKLMAEKGELLNSWVLGRLGEKLSGIDDKFYLKMEKYLQEPGYCRLERKIMKASHYLATNWEFKIIFNLNTNLFGLEETRAKIEDEIEEHYELAGVQKLQLMKKTSNFMDLVGQLRFQQRWAQTPRIPETSVLGHMLIVAMLSYFLSLELGACQKRIYNNFYGGLFHDLPEVLTRDIVSPVKKSVPGLDELIKGIEQRQLEEKLLPLLPSAWHAEIKYFTEDEFKDRIMANGDVLFVSAEELSSKYNHDSFCPLDGSLINICDQFAAYVEAFMSLTHGIRSHHLSEGHKQIYLANRNSKAAGLDFTALFDYFKPEE